MPRTDLPAAEKMIDPDGMSYMNLLHCLSLVKEGRKVSLFEEQAVGSA